MLTRHLRSPESRIQHLFSVGTHWGPGEVAGVDLGSLKVTNGSCPSPSPPESFQPRPWLLCLHFPLLGLPPPHNPRMGRTLPGLEIKPSLQEPG